MKIGQNFEVDVERFDGNAFVMRKRVQQKVSVRLAL